MAGGDKLRINPKTEYWIPVTSTWWLAASLHDRRYHCWLGMVLPILGQSVNYWHSVITHSKSVICCGLQSLKGFRSPSLGTRCLNICRNIYSGSRLELLVNPGHDMSTKNIKLMGNGWTHNYQVEKGKWLMLLISMLPGFWYGWRSGEWSVGESGHEPLKVRTVNIWTKGDGWIKGWTRSGCRRLRIC